MILKTALVVAFIVFDFLLCIYVGRRLKAMERQKIESSSTIKSIGYDGRIAEVEFRDGKVYEVEGLSQKQFADFMEAESKGSWYHRHVKIAGLSVRRKVEETTN